MRRSSFLNIGVNDLNGYSVEVLRYMPSQNDDSRHSADARYWGTITTPDGEVIFMGDRGMTALQIKRKCGIISSLSASEPSELKKLKKLRVMMADSGLPTGEVDDKIAALEEQVEQSRRVNSAEMKALRKELKQLEKMKAQMEACGLSTFEVEEKIIGIHSQML